MVALNPAQPQLGRSGQVGPSASRRISTIKAMQPSQANVAGVAPATPWSDRSPQKLQVGESLWPSGLPSTTDMTPASRLWSDRHRRCPSVETRWRSDGFNDRHASLVLSTAQRLRRSTLLARWAFSIGVGGASARQPRSARGHLQSSWAETKRGIQGARRLAPHEVWIAQAVSHICERQDRGDANCS